MSVDSLGNLQAAKLEISLIPDDVDILDSDWQDECHQLSVRLNEELSELDAKVQAQKLQETGPEGTQYKAVGDLSIFSSLAIFLSEAGALQGVISSIIDILKPWLTPRRGCKAVIKSPDGHEFTLTDLSMKEIIPLMEHFGIDVSNKKVVEEDI